jgi:prepilin-type N-terminal cleavage/methylation domain-containing protein
MSKMRFFNIERKVKGLKPFTTSGKELESSHNRRFSIFSRFFLDFFSISSQTPQLLRASARTTQDSRLTTHSSQLKTHNSRLTTQDSFTLVEMLVVIGIIAILAAILMPALSSARKQVREGATRAEIKNLEVAMTAYYQDWGEYPPDMRGSGDSSAESLVYHLGNTFRVSAGTGEIDASQNGGPYFDFDPKRLTKDPDGDGTNEFSNPVYVDHFGAIERENGDITYYRFDNNEDDGGDESNWHTGYTTDHEGWNVSNVHSSGIDIWSAGEDGDDEIYDLAGNKGLSGDPNTTNGTFVGDADIGDDIGNW